MIYPSIASHIFSAIFMGLSALFALFYFSKLKSLDTYRILILLLLFSIVLGVHGLSHVMLEKEYNYIKLI